MDQEFSVLSAEKAAIDIPHLPSVIVHNKLELAWVAIRFFIFRANLVTRYFGHPFLIFQAIKRLSNFKKSIFGEFKQIKLIKVDGNYFFNLNGPSLFSKGFATNFTDELNRIYKKNPTTGLRVLLMAITKKCSYQCEHCYEWNSLNQKEQLTEEDILLIIRRFQERGVGQIQFGGGDPLNRYQTLINVLKKSSNNSDFTIVTSGYQLTAEKAIELKQAGLTSITISLDHYLPEKHDEFRGYKGAFEWVIKAVIHAKQVGIAVNFSLCATKEFVSKSNLTRYFNLAKQLGIGCVWMIEPRAVGHYANKPVSLSSEQLEILSAFYEQYNFNSLFKEYPKVAYPEYYSRKIGCMGSGNRFLYIDTNGDLKSCPMCGSTHGKAISANLDLAIQSMQAQGCNSFKSVPIEKLVKKEQVADPIPA